MPERRISTTQAKKVVKFIYNAEGSKTDVEILPVDDYYNGVYTVNNEPVVIHQGRPYHDEMGYLQVDYPDRYSILYSDGFAKLIEEARILRTRSNSRKAALTP